MQTKTFHVAAAILFAIAFQHSCHVGAQTVKPAKSVMGTVAKLDFQARELTMATEDGGSLVVKASGETEFVSVPPGVHDLSKASPASPHDIKVGDHVLVSFVDGMAEARRIVFMPAAAIDARNDAERADWEHRGIAGVVASTSGNAIVAQLPGNAKSTINVTAKTKFRRYAPDSVTFTQATSGSIADIAAGDQIRARGQKSEDGSTMTADEVVFGTFQTKAGTITAVDPHSHEITIREVGTKAPLVIRFVAESKLKALPDMKMGPPQSEGQHGAPHGVPTTPSGAVDMAKVLGSLPAGSMDDLKVGGAVVVTSTKGAQPGKVTAIMLLAHAEMFVELMQQQADGNGTGMQELMRSHGMNPAQGLSLPAILQ